MDDDVAAKIRKAARLDETSVSAYISRLVSAGLSPVKPSPDRATVVLEYQSIQLDLLLKHADPDLPKTAKRLFKARTGGEPDAL